VAVSSLCLALAGGHRRLSFSPPARRLLLIAYFLLLPFSFFAVFAQLHLLLTKMNKTSKISKDYITIRGKNYMKKGTNDVINGPNKRLNVNMM